MTSRKRAASAPRRRYARRERKPSSTRWILLTVGLFGVLLLGLYLAGVFRDDRHSREGQLERMRGINARLVALGQRKPSSVEHPSFPDWERELEQVMNDFQAIAADVVESPYQLTQANQPLLDELERMWRLLAELRPDLDWDGARREATRRHRMEGGR